MGEIVMLQGAQSQTILEMVVRSQSPAIMSYLSKDKWHVAKVTMKDLREGRLYVENCHAAGKPHPINIQIDQPVGVNFKHAYGKFVFDTTVVGLEPSCDPEAGGTIVLALPLQVGVVQRRSYFRVNVPKSLRVNVVLWHRSGRRGAEERVHAYSEGYLMDISAGGAQVIVPGRDANSYASTAPEAGEATAGMSDFHKGQFLGARFTPLPYEMPLMFNAQVRSVMPTADHTSLCVGLQIVGLEASEEGRQVLNRLAKVVECYHQLNQSEGQGAPTVVRQENRPFQVPCET
jgi:hypothetical protein